LTIKPVGFRIKVRPRRDRAPLVARTTAPPQAVVHPEHETAATPEMRSGPERRHRWRVPAMVRRII